MASHALGMVTVCATQHAAILHPRVFSRARVTLDTQATTARFLPLRCATPLPCSLFSHAPVHCVMAVVYLCLCALASLPPHVHLTPTHARFAFTIASSLMCSAC